MSDETQDTPDHQNDVGSARPAAVASEFADFKPMRMALIVEGGLFAFGLVVAYFGFFDTAQPLRDIDAVQWRTGLMWGGLGTIPLLIYLATYHFFSPTILQPMREFVDENLKPLFKQCSLVELMAISVSAGFCEELFFRWCLQGGITSLTHSLLAGVLIASIIFGLCHWVNASYGITTMLIGIYLGVLMIWTGTWLAPAVAHTLFDFVALLYIARFENDVKVASNQGRMRG